MSSRMESTYELGEFASFRLVEDEKGKRFTLTLEGDIRYAGLVASKVSEIRVSESELQEWVDAGSD